MEYQVGCPIRKSTDQSLFAAPHGLSQRTTSFIASYRLGIHQTPFSRLIRASERMTVLSALPRFALHERIFSAQPEDCNTTKIMFTGLIISQRPGLGRDRTAWSVYLRLGKTVFCCMIRIQLRNSRARGLR